MSIKYLFNTGERRAVDQLKNFIEAVSKGNAYPDAIRKYYKLTNHIGNTTARLQAMIESESLEYDKDYQLLKHSDYREFFDRENVLHAFIEFIDHRIRKIQNADNALLTLKAQYEVQSGLIKREQEHYVMDIHNLPTAEEQHIISLHLASLYHKLLTIFNITEYHFTLYYGGFDTARFTVMQKDLAKELIIKQRIKLVENSFGTPDTIDFFACPYIMKDLMYVFSVLKKFHSESDIDVLVDKMEVFFPKLTAKVDTLMLSPSEKESMLKPIKGKIAALAAFVYKGTITNPYQKNKAKFLFWI